MNGMGWDGVRNLNGMGMGWDEDFKSLGWDGIKISKVWGGMGWDENL